MVKKHLYYFNRGIVLTFEIFGAIVLIAAAAWLFLIIRLSQGPMNVDFLTQSIKKELNTQKTGFELNVGHTVLTWGGSNEPFEFEMQKVQVSRSDKTPVLYIDKIGIQLSKKYLVFGKLVPKIIKIHGAALHIIRDKDGSFMLNMGDKLGGSDLKNNKDGNNFIKSLLNQMNDSDSLGIIIGLKEIIIKEASVLYEDKKLGVSWKSRTSNINFIRKKGGVLIDSMINVDMGDNKNAYIRGNIFYSWKTLKPNGILQFTGFNPAVFCQDSLALKDFSGIDISLKGSISFELDKKLRLIYSRFILGGDNGSFSGIGIYSKPISVKSFFTQGKLDVSSNKLNIEKLILNLDGKSKLEAFATVVGKDKKNKIDVSAALYNMPIDKLEEYWPKTLAIPARLWVIERLSKGIATKAVLDMSLVTGVDSFKTAKLKKLEGRIDFKNVTVDYLNPLPKVKNVSGVANYNAKSFNIHVKSGNVKGINIKNAKINIMGLDTISKENPANIDINLSMRGGVRSALEVLSNKPLQYPQKLGVNILDINGGADMYVSFKFPLHKKLAASEININASAKLKDIYFKNIVSDMSLENGIMDLSINKKGIKIKGFGDLDGINTNFNWFNSFSKKEDIVSKLEASLPINSSVFNKFGMPSNLKLSGKVISKLTYLVSKNKNSTLMFNGDISNASFVIPILDYKKESGFSGDIGFIAYMNKQHKLYKISSLSLNTKNIILKGNMFFSKGLSNISKAVFKTVKIDKTDVSIDINNRVKGGYIVNISGNIFDASKLFGNKKSVQKKVPELKKSSIVKIREKETIPLSITMNVNKLIMANNKYINKVKLFMSRNKWDRIDHLEVDGISGSAPLKLRYIPSSKGYNLNFEADNAGEALSALGITNSVIGGKLNVVGVPNLANGLRDLAGNVMISDFTLVNVPALGMLLNSISLVGVVELLNGKGISFKKMGAKFWWIDKGMPEDTNNIRLIKIKDGQTSGASLGLTFEGDIDNWSNTINMNGTIIPASGINKIIGAIPLIGGILTGGGEGVFAATYKIKGPTNNPKVTVNPLSVLAPGILRKLFFH